MKQIGAIILLLVMLSVTFSKWLIIAQFRLNQQYISENLCVNKNKPKSCCHGKCFLGKQLVKDEKGDTQGLPEKSKEKTDIQLFYETENCNGISKKYALNIFPSFETNFSLSSFCDACFKPPRSIA
jgi:hypothetical protein